MEKSYQIVIGSPVEYDQLIAEVVMNGKYICFLQQEEGREKLIIEFYGDMKKEKIYLEDFLEALSVAKNTLLK